MTPAGLGGILHTVCPGDKINDKDIGQRSDHVNSKYTNNIAMVAGEKINAITVND